MASRSVPARASTPALLAAIRKQRFGRSIRCLHCGHGRVHRWGSFSGRQRYRCVRCLRTFSDLTGTPIAHLKKVELLPSYGSCLAASLSLRKAAARVGVHVSTAFRWRHRLLDGLRAQDLVTVAGGVQVGLEWFAESRKGERHLERPARRRGVRYPRLGETRGVTVVGACDRFGTNVTVQISRRVPAYRPPAVDDLEAAIAGRIEPGSHLVAAWGRLGAIATVARRLGLGFHDARPPPFGGGGPTGGREGVDVSQVTSYLRLLRDWLKRFRGVATKYLRNYLIWHRWCGVQARRGFAPPWLWPTL